MALSRSRLARILTVLALTATLTLIPTEAHAHYSSYCGHGQVGWYETVTYRGSAGWGNPHYHRYEHRRYDLWRTHSDTWRLCWH